MGQLRHLLEMSFLLLPLGNLRCNLNDYFKKNEEKTNEKRKEKTNRAHN